MKKPVIFKSLIILTSLLYFSSMPLYGQIKSKSNLKQTKSLIQTSQSFKKQITRQIPISQAVYQEIIQKKSKRSNAEKKLSTQLLGLQKQMKISGINKTNAATVNAMVTSSSLLSNTVNVKIDNTARVYVYLKAAKGYSTNDIRNALQTIDGTADIWNDEFGLVQAWVYYEDLTTLAQSPAIRGIDPVLPPHINVGSFTSKGDSCLRSNISRTIFSATGSDVKVGVLSDGCDGYDLSIASSDLPVDFDVIDNTAGGAEGTAMAEIVHDLVPDTQIAFATAFNGVTGFIDNIQALADAGCQVITDDVGYFTEPVFEDGPIAQKINEVASNGVVYTSSSGNSAQKSYQSVFSPVSVNYDGYALTAHNFAGTTQTGLCKVYFPAGETISIILHWDDEYGASANDFDLYLLNEDGSGTIAVSSNEQNGDDDPVEGFTLTNNGTSTVVTTILISRYSVSDNTTPRIKLSYFGYPSYIEETNVYGSSYGHPNAEGCLGVGAIWADDSGYDDIEPFSSQGPATIVDDFSDPIRPRPATIRNKPDIASFDGVSVTGNGGFPTTFYGTSASAPHAAALAAQILSYDIALNGSRTLTSEDVRDIIRNTAVDLGDPGIDYVFGYGRTDAVKALAYLRGSFGSWSCNSNGSDLSIPDQIGEFVEDVLVMSAPADAAVNDIYLSLNISHLSIGDLIVKLKSPDGTERTVLNSPISSANNPNIVLSDAGTSGTIDGISLPDADDVFGYYTPTQTILSLSAFKGQLVNGNWTLSVSDNASGNVGLIKDWGLLIEHSEAPSSIATVSSPTNNLYSFDSPGETSTDIEFTGANGTGHISVVRYGSAPSNVSGVPGGTNISQYRWVIEGYDGFNFSNAQVRFNWSQIPNSGVTSPSTVTIYKRDTPGSGAFSSVSTTVDGSELVTNVTGFSEFIFVSSDNPLPVEISKFTAYASESSINLNWATQTETDNLGFILMRDGLQIASYESNSALKGHGTSLEAHQYNYADQIVELGQTYTYKLISVDYSGFQHEYETTVEASLVESVNTKANAYALYQNYPNPFNPSTTISFNMKQAGLATIKVFDMLGRSVFEKQIEASVGANALTFNASHLTSGIYFYQLNTQGYSKTMKMMLVK